MLRQIINTDTYTYKQVYYDLRSLDYSYYDHCFIIHLSCLPPSTTYIYYSAPTISSWSSL